MQNDITTVLYCLSGQIVVQTNTSFNILIQSTSASVAAVLQSFCYRHRFLACLSKNVKFTADFNFLLTKKYFQILTLSFGMFFNCFLYLYFLFNLSDKLGLRFAMNIIIVILIELGESRPGMLTSSVQLNRELVAIKWVLEIK